MRATLAVLFVLVAFPAVAASIPLGAGHGAIDAPRDVDAVGLGHRFCEARLLGDMSRVEDHLAPRLTRLLDRVAAEDVPWQSVPDRPTNCDIEAVNGIVDTAGVLLEVHYRTDAVAWTDRLSLVRTPGSWLITNIFYEGGGNLRFRLIGAR